MKLSALALSYGWPRAVDHHAARDDYIELRHDIPPWNPN